MSVIVRKAAPGDVGSIVRLLLEEMAPTVPDCGAVDPECVIAGIVADIGRSVVAEKDGEIVGVLSLMPHRFWYSSEIILTDRVFFISEAARRSRAAIKMLRAAKSAARKHHMKCAIGLFSDEDLDRKEAFYARQGFRRIGGIYLMEG